MSLVKFNVCMEMPSIRNKITPILFFQAPTSQTISIMGLLKTLGQLTALDKKGCELTKVVWACQVCNLKIENYSVMKNL